jgi:hypothetical protein
MVEAVPRVLVAAGARRAAAVTIRRLAVTAAGRRTVVADRTAVEVVTVAAGMAADNARTTSSLTHE